MLVLWSVLTPVTVRKKPRVGSLSYQGVLFSNAIIFLTYKSHFKSTVVGGSIPKKYLPSIVKTSVSACHLSAKICAKIIELATNQSFENVSHCIPYSQLECTADKLCVSVDV